MRFFYFILLFFPFLAQAQLPINTSGGAACQEHKAAYFNRITSNPKARVAYAGDPSIDVTYYGLELYLTHTPNYLRGAATVTLKSTAAISSFFLDLNSTTATTGTGLRVDSVKVGNQKISYQHAQNKLTVTPAQPLSTGQALTLLVYYQGVPAGDDSFVFGRHDTTNDPVIWSLSEPYGAPDWFPCKDSPGDKADSSAVRITAPNQFVSVSNGILVSTTSNLDGTRTYHWRNSYPIAQYLISVASTNYERYDTPATLATSGTTLPITHYVYPETLTRVKASLDKTPSMVQLFTNLFGPYPFLREKYGHAQIGRGNGGMEHQTISSMEENAFASDVIAHELAHQWFGDKITCRDWQNIWLNEGFASYAEALYAESANGQAGYQSTMTNFMTRARRARGSIYVQDITNFGNIFSPDRSYAKGAVVLHMLRAVVGQETFFSILRAYAASPTVAYKSAVTEDFQAIAEQVYGQSLNYFFKQWIYGEGYPSYRATVSTNPGTNTVSVRLQQRNAIATNPGSFTMPVQMRIQSAAGDTTVTVFNDQADQTFTLPARGAVTGLLIDPANLILKTVETSTITPITAVNEPLMGNLRVYPNPTAETLTVDFSVYASGPVTLSLTNMLGQRVRTLTESTLGVGDHTRTINLRDLASGRYTLTILQESGQFSRVVLIH
ncbi:T9SS type A sorting domain-containing protein [Spirosoma sp. RP8]|uniref:Aminopeptidase N n=1 Tax=Spirosoma liriopis TaxID=2937440 RepID=A0ABT0HF72_9BACT|nr:M1 family aminopeptidase [Spirosoma liriopis]MCK8490798.1 T9SS type A sorting domain-containing protein [Spirosoma liriopis]